MASSFIGHLLVFLLLLLPLSLVAAVDKGRFDFRNCKDRLCLVNKGCGAIPADKKFTAYDDDTPCKILLAIWPYSVQKWRLTIQTDVVSTSEITLQIRESGKDAIKLVKCTNEKGTFKATNFPDYTAEIVDWSADGSFFLCDLILKTTLDNFFVSKGFASQFELKYGKGDEDYVFERLDLLSTQLFTFEGICNPDMIQFNQSMETAPGRRLKPANSDQFALKCPDSYHMMFDNGSGFRRVKSIECTKLSDEQGKPHAYKITPMPGQPDIEPLDRTKEFSAHCAYSVCTQCHPIKCTSESNSTINCPRFTPANETDEESCAELTCPDDTLPTGESRFTLSSGQSTVSMAVCEEGGWTIGGHANVTEAVCAKTVACQSLVPLTCSDESCSVIEGSVVCKDPAARLKSSTNASFSSISCNNQTGEWTATFMNESSLLLREPEAFACARNATRRYKYGMMTRWILGVIIVSVYFGFGCAWMVWGNRRYGLGDNENPRITEGLLEYYRKEMEKEEKAGDVEAARRGLFQEQGSVQTMSDEPVAAPTTTTTKRRKKKETAVESARSTRTARPLAPSAETTTASAAAPPSQLLPPLLSIVAPAPALTPTAPLPAASGSAEFPPMAPDNQYEPIPGLGEAIVEPAPAAPGAPEAGAPPPPPPQPPSSGGADDQYEEIPGIAPGQTPPPPPSPPQQKPEEQYVEIDPKSRVPPPPPSMMQASQMHAPHAPGDATPPPRASQYYANSRLVKDL